MDTKHEEKASWLRSEIEKLEGEMRECPNHDPEEPVECYGYDEYYNQALTSIITRYKEELKVLTRE